MARAEMYKEGRTPLHTFHADIDYALAEANTKVGLLGIKVWVCNGEVYGKRDLTPNAGVAANGSNAQSSGRRDDRRGGGRNGRGGRRDDRRGRNDRGDRRERPAKEQ